MCLNFIKKKLEKDIKEMSVAQAQNTVVLPNDKTLSQAFKLALKIGKQIDCYFYLDSCAGNVKIVTYEGDKILYKNNEEHTSPIKNTYKVENEYLVVTENTIYILSTNTPIVKS